MVTNDDKVRYAMVCHRLKAEGLNPNAPVTQGMLTGVLEKLGEQLTAAAERFDMLEKKLNAIQVKIDHAEKHSLSFRGDWQTAATYPQGCVVRHRDGVYCALREILPGKAEPGRQGAGWDRII